MVDNSFQGSWKKKDYSDLRLLRKLDSQETISGYCYNSFPTQKLDFQKKINFYAFRQR